MSRGGHAEVAREMGDRVQHRLAGIAARGGDLQRAHRFAGAAADDVGEGAADVDADIDRWCRVGHAGSCPPPGCVRCLDSTAGLRSCRLPAAGRDDRNARRVPTITRPDQCPTRGSSRRHRPDRRRTRALGSPHAGARRLPDGDIHGGGGKLHRRHRDADDRRRSRRVQPVLLGVRGLPADAGGEHSGLWPARRHLRPQEGVLLRRRAVPGRLHAVRLRRQHGDADPVPRAAGLRRRRRAADRHHHPRRHLHADRARARAGPGVQRVRRRRGAGPVARRVPGRAGELAAGVLGQPADRRRGDRHDRDVPARAGRSIARTASTISDRCC